MANSFLLRRAESMHGSLANRLRANRLPVYGAAPPIARRRRSLRKVHSGCVQMPVTALSISKKMATLKEGTIHALVDPEGTRQYVESTAQTLENDIGHKALMPYVKVLSRTFPLSSYNYKSILHSWTVRVAIIWHWQRNCV